MRRAIQAAVKWNCCRYVMRYGRRTQRTRQVLSRTTMYLRLRPLLYSKHTWYNSDSLQGSEDSKCPESGKVAQIYAHRHITAIHPNITHITVIRTKSKTSQRKSGRDYVVTQTVTRYFSYFLPKNLHELQCIIRQLLLHARFNVTCRI